MNHKEGYIVQHRVKRIKDTLSEREENYSLIDCVLEQMLPLVNCGVTPTEAARIACICTIGYIQPASDNES